MDSAVTPLQLRLMSEKLLALLKQLFLDASRISLNLFKIIIPVLIIARLLDVTGLIEVVGRLLSPVMNIVGLPGSMGLVWASAMVTGVTGSMLVFAALAPGVPLTVAQVTVLSAIILTAHSLLVELRIGQKAGLRLGFQLSLRIVTALVYGWLLNQVLILGEWLQTPNRMVFNLPLRDLSWLGWGISQIKNLAVMFLFIFGLLLMLRLLDAVGLTRLLVRLLSPVLNLLGISSEAAPLTIIGMVMGLGYGGGLIIREVQTGKLGKYDTVFAIMLMAVLHSIVEDPLYMIAIGADFNGLFWGRTIFNLLVVFVLVRLIRRLPDDLFHRYLYRKP